MYVAQWMHFTDTYRATYSGYGCTVLADRAEGTRLLIRIDNAGTLDVPADHVGEVRTMHEWNDYHSYDLNELIALQVETKARRNRGVQCDNDAPGTCCDDCNFHIINEVLTERLSD